MTWLHGTTLFVVVFFVTSTNNVGSSPVEATDAGHNPQNKPNAMSTEELLVLGNDSKQRGDFKTAAKCAQIILARDNDNAEGLLLEARLAYVHFHWQAAAKRFIRVAQLDKRIRYEAYSSAAYSLFMFARQIEESNVIGANVSATATVNESKSHDGTSSQHHDVVKDDSETPIEPNTSELFTQCSSYFDLAQIEARTPNEMEQILLARATIRSYVCDWSRVDADRNFLRSVTERDLTHEKAFVPVLALHYALPTEAALHRQVATVQAQALGSVARRSVPPHFTSFSPLQLPGWHMGRLVLGYVSGNLGDVSIGHNMWIHYHQNPIIELQVFSTMKDDGSIWWSRVAKAANGRGRFHMVSGGTSFEIAARINDAKVHVLLHTDGLTRNNELGTLSLRPAPIIVNLFGSQGTTGCVWIDSMVTDRFVSPPEFADDLIESQWYMPLHQTFFATEYKQSRAHVLAKTSSVSREAKLQQHRSRSELGLPQHPTLLLANFNILQKIDPESFDVWTELMASYTNSSLWLQYPPRAAKENILKHIRSTPMSDTAKRVHFTGKTSFERHLVDKAASDLVLDTLGVNGHVTTADTLWAGVPIVTTAGRTMSSRVSASLLLAITPGADTLARDNTDYYDTAMHLARHRNTKLRTHRSQLCAARSTSTLFDTVLWVSSLERATLMQFDVLVSHGGVRKRFQIIVA